MTAALACQKTSQHQTSTGLLWACGGNRVTSAFSRSPMCSPTSTPKPRAEGSSPSAPAKNGEVSRVLTSPFFVSVPNVLATRCGCALCSACRGASERQWRSAASRPSRQARQVRPSIFAMLWWRLPSPPCSITPFLTRPHPASIAPIPSSTQNAPGFAFFGLFRVRFAVFVLF